MFLKKKKKKKKTVLIQFDVLFQLDNNLRVTDGLVVSISLEWIPFFLLEVTPS